MKIRRDELLWLVLVVIFLMFLASHPAYSQEPPKEEPTPQFIVIPTADFQKMVEVVNALIGKIEEMEKEIRRLRATTGCT